jgi:hypothetical protein
MFGCDSLGWKINVVFDVRVMVGADVLDDLASERQDRLFMRHLILMDMDG